MHEAAEIKLRAERMAGEVLAEMERQGHGRPEKTSHDETFSKPTLSDIGVARQQASRWQAEASVPEPDFEAWVAGRKVEGHRLQP
jgi:hypothetical protein